MNGYKQQIRRILHEFDFDAVHDHMVRTDWWWASSDGVPDKARMKQTARWLLQEAATDPDVTDVATGGFKASAPIGERLTLEFIIERA